MITGMYENTEPKFPSQFEPYRSLEQLLEHRLKNTQYENQNFRIV